MSRLLALAATAALLLAPGVRAEAPASGAATVDPKVDPAVKAAIEKAKQELREELKPELQGLQSRAEFLGASAEGPRLQLLELDGYLRVRGDLLDNLA
ncbi:MAG: putative porin, partial [Anaeromyxobacteraceae bacterium]|nr:putative porin [Anaeromyxobacteraceae bacterium]